MAECIFCRIISGEIPSQIVYQDDAVIAFRDIEPVAPFHVLVVPRRHIGSLAEVESADQETLGRLLAAAAEVARRQEAAAGGYRVVINCGEQGGQTVSHLHIHVLAGRYFGWPPG